MEIRCRHGATGEVGLGTGDDQFPENAPPLAGQFVEKAGFDAAKKPVAKLPPPQKIVAHNVGNHSLPDLLG